MKTINKTKKCSYMLKFSLFLGTLTDGEFDSLRKQGESCPLYIRQVVHNSKDIKVQSPIYA